MDVPAKLSALARLLDTGHNRKTDAHAVAVVAVRTTGLRVLSYVDELEALRMLADRREELTRQRVQTINRLQRLLSELLPGTDPVTALEQTAFGHDDLGRAGGDWRYYPLCPMARTTQRSAIGVVTLRSL
ncbi:MAG: IS110 family transposase [Humibacillus sp.]|nr:IS110 family transposase [Humibacillus sp.]MDN5777999.1 IS110 family transposase [Humibacillus sp.]